MYIQRILLGGHKHKQRKTANQQRVDESIPFSNICGEQRGKEGTGWLKTRRLSQRNRLMLRNQIFYFLDPIESNEPPFVEYTLNFSLGGYMADQIDSRC